MIDFVFILTALVLAIYSPIIGLFIYGVFRGSKGASQEESSTEMPTASIIIAIRNEEEHILDILGDMMAQDYERSKFELILVNDESEDKSVEIMEHFIATNNISCKLVHSKGGKKAAIAAGVQYAQYEILLFTDADCRVGENWVRMALNAFNNPKLQMLMGAVLYDSKGFSQKMMSVEFTSLLAFGAGAAAVGLPIMSNGANYGVRASAMKVLQADYLHSETPSGDDVFLLSALRKVFGNSAIQYSFAPELKVLTAAPPSWKAFILQRIRWGSKAKFYHDFLIQFFAIIMGLVNLFFAFLSVILLLNPMDYWIPFTVFFVVKTFLDLLLIHRFSANYKQKANVLFIPIVQLLYPFYLTITGILSFIIPVKWKGRTYKN